MAQTLFVHMDASCIFSWATYSGYAETMKLPHSSCEAELLLLVYILKSYYTGISIYFILLVFQYTSYFCLASHSRTPHGKNNAHLKRHQHPSLSSEVWNARMDVWAGVSTYPLNWLSVTLKAVELWSKSTSWSSKTRYAITQLLPIRIR